MCKVSTEQIGVRVRELALDIAINLSSIVENDLKAALAVEVFPPARRILEQILENARLAAATHLPLCQDTGLVQVLLELGPGLYLSGPALPQVVEVAVRSAYADGFLRKSACQPLSRENSGDNTPASVEIVYSENEGLRLTVLAKGGGCDNTSRLMMLKPVEGWAGVRRMVLTAVAEAGPGACPPFYLGVAVGGTFESAPRLAKWALMDLGAGETSEEPRLAAELLEAVNATGLGPAGLGGRTTALGLALKIYPTHIASLPVAVNINCHSFRLRREKLAL